MPSKKRRQMFTFGAITAGSFTPAIDVSSFTKGIMFAARGAAGTVVTMQASPDGGSTWNDAYNGDEDKLEIDMTTIANQARGVDVLPQLIRFQVTVQNAAGVWFEGIREIA